MDLLYSHLYFSGGASCMKWSLNSNSNISVRLYYECMKGATRRSFLWKCVWSSKVPQKVAFFVWIVVLDKTLIVYKKKRIRL